MVRGGVAKQQADTKVLFIERGLAMCITTVDTTVRAQQLKSVDVRVFQPRHIAMYSGLFPSFLGPGYLHFEVSANGAARRGVMVL